MARGTNAIRGGRDARRAEEGRRRPRRTVRGGEHRHRRDDRRRHLLDPRRRRLGDGQLPKTFTNAIWNRHVEGLFITGGLSVVFVLTFDLGPIAMMASAAFLIVYSAVNAAHLRLLGETGAKRAIVIASLLACMVMFVLLMIDIVGNAPAASWVTLLATLVGSFLIEIVYRKRTGRHFERLVNPSAGPPPVAATASHG